MSLQDLYALWHGDCMEFLPRIPDASVDLIASDLPYGVTKIAWDTPLPLDKLWEQYRRILAPCGAIVLTARQPFTSVLIASNLPWFKYSWVWVKEKPTGYLNANYRPLNLTEDAAVFYPLEIGEDAAVFSPAPAGAGGKHSDPMRYQPQGVVETHVVHKNYAGRVGKAVAQVAHQGKNNQVYSGSEFVQKFTNYPMNLLVFPRDKNAFHPTQKPVALMEYFVLTYTQPGALVLDNCMGSGTTGVACARTDRRFIGMELDDKFYDYARSRVQEAYAAGPKTSSPQKEGERRLAALLARYGLE